MLQEALYEQLLIQVVIQAYAAYFYLYSLLLPLNYAGCCCHEYRFCTDFCPFPDTDCIENCYISTPERLVF